MSDENRIISQEEIEEILRNSGQLDDVPAEVMDPGLPNLPNIDDYLSRDEQDALGEMGNICMGTAATTMYTLIGKKVNITTPQLSMHTWETMAASHVLPLVVVEICYIEGIEGNNMLLLKEFDVALITDLLMGGDGNIDPNNIVLDEIHLSAIREVMNQMVGSSSTSLAQLLCKTINISTPTSKRVLLRDEPISSLSESQEPILKIAFRMEIEGLLESEIMQVLPVHLAKQIAQEMLNPGAYEDAATDVTAGPATDPLAHTSVSSDFADMFEEAPQAQSAYPPPPPPPQQAAPQQAAPPPPQEAYPPPQGAYPPPPQGAYPPPGDYQQAQGAYPPPYPPQPYPPYPPQGAYPPPPPGYGMPPYPNPYDMQGGYAPMRTTGPIRSAGAANVQEVEYPHFDGGFPSNLPAEQQNIYRLLDVPMEVTVELGRTKRTIKQVLDMNVGSVIVLEKLAGEEVEILVNGIQVARGEVVVIDDSYGVRITELNQTMLSEAAQNT